jgi:uncharacterized protein
LSTRDASGPAARTSLHEAAIDGGSSEVREAIEAGGDIDARDRDGNTALFLAATNHSVDALLTLLAAGADTEVENTHGNTPLWAATFFSRGDGTLIEALLAHGANADHLNHSGNTPRRLAKTVANYDLERFFRPDPTNR